ncbi:alpha/beta fold hydrolase, partial [Pseudomonas aeruginosa]
KKKKKKKNRRPWPWPWLHGHGSAERCEAGISAACLDVARYRLEMPGLVVHAGDDPRVAVENAERIHAAWPASRLLRLPGGGHYRLLGERRLSESLLALLEERPAMRACRRVEKTASAS